MKTHDVIVVGGGPTGLMLAAELALAGVDVCVVERRKDQTLAGSRAGGLHARTIEVLDQRGVAERFLSQGKAMQVAGFAMIRLDISDFPTRHAYGLALYQNRIEQILAEWVGALPVQFERGVGVADLAQDEEDGVHLTLENGDERRAKFVVGCDGGRSVVRKKAGIEFPGWDASVTYLIAECTMDSSAEAAFGIRLGEKGVNGLGKLDPSANDARVRLVLIEKQVMHGDEPSIDELRAALVNVYGSDFGVRDITWLSRFSDASRQAATYRKGRVLVAGDAAHVHAPAGGQGLNIGVQDAVNLGWKLAQVVRGHSPDALLDTYHAERHPVGARVLELTMAQTALQRGDERTLATHKQVTAMLAMDEPRKHWAGIMSGLELRYDLGQGDSAHPLVGRRMPDLDVVVTSNSSTQRVFSFLHDARPVLLNFGTKLDVRPRDRIKRIDAEYTGTWELPVLGVVRSPSAVLIRPDGYVAWVGEGTDAGLTDALTKWFG